MANNEKEKTPFNKMCEMVPSKMAYFVRWWCTPEKEREDWDKYKGNCGGVSLDTAQTYLLKKDVQQAVKFWMNANKTNILMKTFFKMYDEAVNKGNINAANWLEKFLNSDYFDKSEDSQDEIKQTLKQLNIPAFMDNKGGE